MVIENRDYELTHRIADPDTRDMIYFLEFFGKSGQRPRICGECIYYFGDRRCGFCWLNGDEPRRVSYHQRTCSRAVGRSGRKNAWTMPKEAERSI